MKPRVILKLALFTLMIFLMVSCAWQEKTYKIEWKLDDETVLKVDKVKEGVLPEYNGSTPTKEPTNDKVYVFEGWEPEIVAATQNTAYVAIFSEKVRMYEIRWENYDGTLLKTEYLEYGSSLSYSESEPTRPDGEHQSYVFDGWSFKGDTIVTKDATYTAQFKEILYTYTITWMSDGEVIELDENVEYGSMASFDGDTPTKESTNEKIYFFDGWDQRINFVEGNEIYVAVFREVDNVWNHYPSTNAGVKTFGSKEYWVFALDPTLIVFEKPAIGIINEQSAPSADEIANWNEDVVRLIQPLFDGQYVTLGSYPTNKVTDATLYDNLKSQLEKTAPTAADGKWKAYTHWYDYNGNASDKKGVAKKDALYQDIVYNGEKYRAVYFNSGLAKRCDQTYSNSNQQQQTNGYNTNTLYFFDYQPLKWMIVEETESYYTLVATRVLDGVCFSHTGTAGYVNQYSSMRLFTEGSFYDWAFSDAEKELLASVTFANNKASGNKDDSADLTKSITIPSVIDVLNVFFTSQDSRKKLATDYAKLNGVQVNDAGQGYWWTRSRGASNPIRITPGGSKDENANGYFSSAGIVPQIFISK